MRVNDILVGQSSWRSPSEPLHPWVNTISRILSVQDLPELGGEVLYVVSDYGGNHQKSKYLTTSILLMDLGNSSEWELKRRDVRESHLRDGRRMSFKGLNDVHRRRALVPFLKAADSIHGICVTIAVHKSIRFLCTDKENWPSLMPSLKLQARWSNGAFENAMRLVHFVSLLVGGFSRKGQEVYWISDQDDFFANRIFSEDVAAMVSRFTSHYAKHPLAKLGVGTTDLDEGDRLEEDLAAIPDLAAGAVSDIATAIANASGGRLPDGIAIEVPKLSGKAELLTDWLADHGQRLKRPIISFD